MKPTVVMAGTAPEKGTPTQHGFHLSLQNPHPAASTRFVNLLLPLEPGQQLPVATLTEEKGGRLRLELKWADQSTESVDLNLDWKDDSANGPATIKNSGAQSK